MPSSVPGKDRETGQNLTGRDEWSLAPERWRMYRGTSLIRNSHPPKIATRPHAEAYCRLLVRVGSLCARYPCNVLVGFL